MDFKQSFFCKIIYSGKATFSINCHQKDSIAFFYEIL